MKNKQKVKIINVVGARPNFVKIAPINKRMEESSSIEPFLLHTGQHYDSQMSENFFSELNIKQPDINLNIGSHSQTVQTAKMMIELESVINSEDPDAVLVVGDVNSTLAASLVASKMGVYLIHVESGLRSHDLSMPEEVNRIVTDRLSNLLFCSEQSGVDNLISEGVDPETIFLVGNVMIDTLIKNQSRFTHLKVLKEHGLQVKKYALMTLHRPSNVNDENNLRNIFRAILTIQQDINVIFPAHPRTREVLKTLDEDLITQKMPNLVVTEPFGYIDFMTLTKHAAIVLTDSGGLQEESTIHGVPCLTLRENTERPATITNGSNHLVGTGTEEILRTYNNVMSDQNKKFCQPDLWDGKASERIISIIEQKLGIVNSY